jgi:hypothetical protein
MSAKFSLIVLLILLPRTLALAIDEPVRAIIDQNSPQPLLRDKNIWLSAEALTSPMFTEQWAVRAGAGYQFEILGADFHFTYAEADHERLQVTADSATSTYRSATNAESEINRTRQPSDSWNFWLTEIGGSAIGNVFPFLPDLREKGWVGIGMGKFSDDSHALQFWGTSLGFETSLLYPLLKPASLFANASVGYHAALLLEESHHSQEGRLPIQWLTVGLGATWYGF